ncbi:MAG: hypothetical protein KDM63_05895 [Verrucomicrobiae bacterium]|nr:hypothetical protein [Verrucomicrobiae bacterium]
MKPPIWNVSRIVWIAVLCSTWSESLIESKAQQSAASELLTLRDLQQRFEQQRSLIEKPIAELNQLYEQQLGALREKARDSGDLDRLLEIDQELKGYRQPDDQAAKVSFPELVRLRDIYRNELNKRRQSVATDLAAFQTRYVEQLEALAKELTRLDRLEDAVAARDEARKMSAAIEPASLTGAMAMAESGTQGKGGKLKGFGFGPKAEPVGSTARGISDVVDVKYWERDTFDAGWVALRANGTLFSDKDQRLITSGPGGARIVAFACSGGGGIVALKSDGTLDASLATFQPPAELMPKLVDLVDIALGQNEGGPDGEAAVAVKKDGSLLWWGPAAKAPGVGGPPEEARTGVAKVVSGRGIYTALKRDGSLVAWKFQSGGDGRVDLPSEASGTGFKQVAMSEGHSVALKEDGSVVAWGPNNEGQSTVPAGLGRCTEVAVLHNVGSLARKEDGTWVAWGRSYGGLTEHLNGKTGITRVVGRMFPPGKYAYGVWIEEEAAK